MELMVKLNKYMILIHFGLFLEIEEGFPMGHEILVKVDMRLGQGI
jgi:hypothetical protein